MFKFGPQFGLALSAIMFVSILCHELFGHILIARMTGGRGDEILMWPLGGLAFVQTAPNFQSRFMTAFGGPLVNFTICLLSFPALYFTPYARAVWNPFELPIAGISGDHALQDILVLIFHMNWILGIVNMIPAYPLDGGRMLEAFMSDRADSNTVKMSLLNTGMIIGVISMGVGFVFDSMMLVCIGTLILVLNQYESVLLQVQGSYEENFMGYDFSQGYTSLEKHERTTEKKPGFIAQWRARRKLLQKRKSDQKLHELEKVMDELLAKVSATGLESLTSAEKRQLQNASDMLRHRPKPGKS